VTNHHRFVLQLQLQHIDALDAALNAIDRESTSIRALSRGGPAPSATSPIRPLRWV